ncbi:GNAT family N-acetyltransferase [Sphingoaurantiacus capsulatus]|uniref:GNAT family N-acetyltransferase n=1 Tax=Sphingoaurantiacus capsulatus TaxID=1771310 RepID=A0ABV7XAJ1_9SPHN
MIETERLLVRPWQDSDRAPFAEMGQDPEVMATLGPLMSRAEVDAAVDRLMAHQAKHGFCFWALERKADGMFLGFCGLKAEAAAPHLAGELETGWRLRRDAWGGGYAREAAEASLGWALANTSYKRVIAITTPGNVRSWGLMERLGMHRLADGDFDHPSVPDGDPLKPHITYAIDRPR